MVATLSELCARVIAFNIEEDGVLCKNVLRLPLELINLVVDVLPPLPLHYLKKQSTLLPLKRKHDAESVDFESAWKRLVVRDHSKTRKYQKLSSTMDDYSSWEQFYWDAHIETCLVYVQGHLEDPIPDDLMIKIGGKKAAEFSTVKSLFAHFYGYLRSLKVDTRFCTRALYELLRPARLVSISFSKPRVRLHPAGDWDYVIRILNSQKNTLRRVKFSNCIPDGPGLAEFISQSRCLQRVELLQAVNETKFVWDVFEPSEFVSTLRVQIMDLGRPGFQEVCEKLEKASSKLRLGVETLDLRYCSLLNSSYLVRYLHCLPLLKTLMFGHTSIRDDGLKILASFLRTSGSHIQNLNVESCGITDLGVAVLLDGTLSFKSLSISDNYLGRSAGTLLAKFLGKCKVEELDISEIALGPQGCTGELTSALILNQSLVSLNISKNRLAQAGAGLLRDMIIKSSGTLRNINASFNIFGEKSLKLIADALHSAHQQGRTLPHLDLRGSPGAAWPGVFELFQPFVDGPEPVVLLSAHLPVHDYDP